MARLSRITLNYKLRIGKGVKPTAGLGEGGSKSLDSDARDRARGHARVAIMN